MLKYKTLRKRPFSCCDRFSLKKDKKRFKKRQFKAEKGMLEPHFPMFFLSKVPTWLRKVNAVMLSICMFFGAKEAFLDVGSGV